MLKSLKLSMALCLIALATLAQAATEPKSDYYAIEDIQGKYSAEQFQKISETICMNFDFYKSNSKSIKKKFTPGCKGQYEFVCREDGDFLDMRAIVRSSISEVLKISDPVEFEKSIPPVISQLLKYSCEDVSYHFDLDIPFLKQHRNMVKRAIFLGYTRYIFDEFIFDEYSYEENGRRKLSIDINAVEYVDGEPETLLDYLDKILEVGHASRLGGSSRGDVIRLREMIINRGAKYSRELEIK